MGPVVEEPVRGKGWNDVGGQSGGYRGGGEGRVVLS